MSSRSTSKYSGAFSAVFEEAFSLGPPLEQLSHTTEWWPSGFSAEGTLVRAPHFSHLAKKSIMDTFSKWGRASAPLN